eukprot:Clim_evm15s152 gene=Clim_evmTU15s152
MSDQALPLLIINLGAEMTYVLHERLKAQGVSVQVQNQVISAIVYNMVRRRFLEEMMRPQPLYNLVQVRSICSRLAHSSVMKLNDASMDKLFDLVLMSYKWQLIQINSPEEVYTIALNHLDTLKDLVPLDRKLQISLDSTMDTMTSVYESMSKGSLWIIRQELLNFTMSKHAQISLFVAHDLQSSDGCFRIDIHDEDSDEPIGKVDYYDPSTGQAYETTTPSKKMKPKKRAAIFDFLEDTEPRGTFLGKNLFAVLERKSRGLPAVIPKEQRHHSLRRQGTRAHPLRDTYAGSTEYDYLRRSMDSSVGAEFADISSLQDSLTAARLHELHGGETTSLRGSSSSHDLGMSWNVSQQSMKTSTSSMSWSNEQTASGTTLNST